MSGLASRAPTAGRPDRSPAVFEGSRPGLFASLLLTARCVPLMAGPPGSPATLYAAPVCARLGTRWSAGAEGGTGADFGRQGRGKATRGGILA